jgi:flavodoxin/NAD-dependent dihydropyrimidine dehydrogenase PreA subunit
MVYFSKDGATEKIATQIAEGIKEKKYSVDLCNLNKNKAPSVEGYDVIGIGFPVYYSRAPFNILDYVKSLPDLRGKSFFVFTTFGNIRGDASTQVRIALRRKGAHDIGYFFSRGANHFVGYLKDGYLFSSTHPEADEIHDAKKFGKDVVDNFVSGSAGEYTDDLPAPFMYRLERAFLNQWMVSNVLSRLFTVDKKKCTDCGTCIEQCPAQNIVKINGKKVWGRDCLFCLQCETRCPADAISSAMTWKVCRPVIIYNIHDALKNPEIKYSRITHAGGKTSAVK